MQKKMLYAFLAIALFACDSSETPVEVVETPKEFKVEFEKFELENGLDVVFHIDRSDPVVAVALTAHVGSSREKIGRTGFAHLFEHLLFLESENLGKGGLDKMSARIGGSGANGSTSRDRTNYFQTVPKDALEKMLWAEADKLGWFINTVTEPVLAKEKEVVKNEKRQNIDNVPYGQNNYVIGKAMYPESHPYNWQVIGSLEDLQNATLEDVKEFFRRWYVPNNVTLVVSGDFDEATAKAWIHKYFDEIPRGEEVERLPKTPAKIAAITKLSFEDNYATLPQLTMVWPGVEMYHDDQYALDVLAHHLTQGKKAPFYKVLVEEKKLTSEVDIWNGSSELAGEIELSVKAFEGQHLDSVHAEVFAAFERFESEGISENDLMRIKAGQETDFYNGLSSVLGKGFQLAQYNIFAEDPDFINKEIKLIQNVSVADVMRVYETYIKGKNYIATSFVPKGNLSLALSGSTPAIVPEEKIDMNANEAVDASALADFERTPSTFDRTVEPPYGAAPEVIVPTVWKAELSNGVAVLGIENKEVPLVNFNIVIQGGLLMESMDKIGVSNLMASMMTRGTRDKTPEELEAAIQQLGASISVWAGTEDVRIQVNTLAKNYQETLKLVEEILFEPRWDEAEFDLLMQSVLATIRDQEGRPRFIANNEFNRLIYGEDNIRSKNRLGTAASLNTITLKDLKDYYSKNLVPSLATMHFVGDLDQKTIMTSLSNFEKEWHNHAVTIPEYPTPQAPAASKIYFYDIPNAKQSVIQIGYPALAVTDEDYRAVEVMNYRLGGGSFASQLTQELREGKGYTYGIRSSFDGSKAVGPFTISTGVRTNVTLESLNLIKSIVDDYGPTYTEKDLETSKGFLIKSNARAFETASAKLRMLENMSTYDWPANYVKDEEAVVNGMTVERVKALSETYLNTDKMIWLVVGDAKTQFNRLKDLGFGDPILLNP